MAQVFESCGGTKYCCPGSVASGSCCSGQNVFDLGELTVDTGATFPSSLRGPGGDDSSSGTGTTGVGTTAASGSTGAPSATGASGGSSTGGKSGASKERVASGLVAVGIGAGVGLLAFMV